MKRWHVYMVHFDEVEVKVEAVDEDAAINVAKNLYPDYEVDDLEEELEDDERFA